MPPPTRSTTSCRWRSAAPNTTRPTAGLPVPTTIAAEARGPTSRRVPDSRRRDHPQHPPHHPPSLTPIALSNYPTASVGPSASNSRITHLIPHHDDACAATLSNPPAHHPPTGTLPRQCLRRATRFKPPWLAIIVAGQGLFFSFSSSPDDALVAASAAAAAAHAHFGETRSAFVTALQTDALPRSTRPRVRPFRFEARGTHDGNCFDRVEALAHRRSLFRGS